jgi:hypothetical protein
LTLRCCQSFWWLVCPPSIGAGGGTLLAQPIPVLG